jgi:hypothetical protein
MSDQMRRQDAEIELSQFECIAANGSETDSSSVQWRLRKPLSESDGFPLLIAGKARDAGRSCSAHSLM